MTVPDWVIATGVEASKLKADSVEVLDKTTTPGAIGMREGIGDCFVCFVEDPRVGLGVQHDGDR